MKNASCNTLRHIHNVLCEWYEEHGTEHTFLYSISARSVFVDQQPNWQTRITSLDPSFDTQTKAILFYTSKENANVLSNLRPYDKENRRYAMLFSEFLDVLDAMADMEGL